MESYEIEKLLPGWLDDELLDWYKFLYSLSVCRKAIIRNDDITMDNYIDNTIEFYRINFNINITHKDLVKRAYLVILYIEYRHNWLFPSNNDDLRKLLFYDLKTLTRVSNIYGIKIDAVFRNLFTRVTIIPQVYSNIEYMEMKQTTLDSINPYTVYLLPSTYEPGVTQIRTGYDNIDLSIANDLTYLWIIGGSHKKIILPPSLIFFQSDIPINKDIKLNDGLLYLSAYVIDSDVVFPESLKYISAVLKDDVKLPSKLEGLKLVSRLSDEEISTSNMILPPSLIYLKSPCILTNLKYLTKLRVLIYHPNIPLNEIPNNVEYLNVCYGVHKFPSSLKILIYKHIYASTERDRPIVLPKRLKYLENQFMKNVKLNKGLKYIINPTLNRIPRDIEFAWIDKGMSILPPDSKLKVYINGDGKGKVVQIYD